MILNRSETYRGFRIFRVTHYVGKDANLKHPFSAYLFFASTKPYARFVLNSLVAVEQQAFLSGQPAWRSSVKSMFNFNSYVASDEHNYAEDRPLYDISAAWPL